MAGQPSTSRAISAARCRGGRTCSAARNASDIASREMATASGCSSPGAASVEQPVGVGLQPRHLGDASSPRSAGSCAGACPGRHWWRSGTARRGTAIRRRSRTGRARPSGTSPAPRPRPRRTRPASGSSGRAAHAGAVRPGRRTRNDPSSALAPVDLLQQPDVAVRVGEVGERLVVLPLRVRSVHPLPGHHVPYRADRHAAPGQFVARRDDVGDDQVQALRRAGRGRGDPGAEPDRALRAGRDDLDDPLPVADRRCRRSGRSPCCRGRTSSPGPRR